MSATAGTRTPWYEEDFDDEKLEELLDLVSAGNASALQLQPDRFGIDGQLRDVEGSLLRLKEARDEALAELGQTDTAADEKDLGSASSWFSFETTFNVPSGEPYIVRVRAEHVAGGIEDKSRWSEWAYVPWAVKPSCQFGRFLPGPGMGIKQ